MDRRLLEWWGWGTVAAGIVILEAALKRTGRPFLSHTWWDGLDRGPSRAVQVAAWTAVSTHLFGRRRWPDAIKDGLIVAGADATRRRYSRGS